MAKWNDVVITDMGMQLSAQTLAGKKIVYTHAQTTDLDLSGKTPDQIQAMTELTSVKQDIPISSISVNDKETVRVVVKITNEGVKQDYMLYGLAVFAKIDDNPEVLYEVVTAQKPDLVPALTGTTLSGINFSLLTHVAKSENASIIVGAGGLNEDEVLELINNHTIDLSDYVTKAQLATKVTDLNNGLSTKVTDNKNGTIEVNGANILPANENIIGRLDGTHTDMHDISMGWWYINGWNGVSGLSNWGLPQDLYYLHCFKSSIAGLMNIQIAYGLGLNNTYTRTMKVTGWTTWKLLADDSKVVHSADMRKPASDVAGIEEVNAKQDKIGYTPADDSKVVHTTDTSNWQKSKITSDSGDVLKGLLLANNDDLNAYLTGLSTGITTFYVQSGVANNPSTQSARGLFHCTGDSVGVGYLIDNNGNQWSIFRPNRASIIYTQLETTGIESKVVHNTGNEEIAGQKTFDVAPIDKTTGNPYITKSDVATAVSAVNANVVHRNPDTGVVSEPVDFTKLTVNGGKSVATRDDLKSLEASAWRPLTLANSTSGTILFKDNGDGTASLIGSATFTIAKGTTTLTPVITPPTGYTFTSLKWSKGINNKGVYVTRNMTGVSSGTSYVFDTSLSNGDICFLGSSDDIYTVTFSPSELTTLNTAAACNPALVSISKV